MVAGIQFLLLYRKREKTHSERVPYPALILHFNFNFITHINEIVEYKKYNVLKKVTEFT
jgi:hypothetical protein